MFQVQTIRLTNSTAEEVDLRIEPLGDHVIMPSGVIFEVVATDQLGNKCLDISIANDVVILNGWMRSVSLVALDGELTGVWRIP